MIVQQPAHQWDVVIVGARVAGSALALKLARAGRRVLCIERGRRGSDTLSTHALMRGGVLLLQRWGLTEALVGAETPPIRRTVFDYGDERVEVSIRPTAGVDALYAPRRTVLDVALVDAAERAGAVFEFGTAVTGLHRDAAGRVDGVSVRRGARTAVVAARLVIGADGRSSVVAADTAAPVTARGRHAGAYLYGYWSGHPAEAYEWFYRAGSSAGVIPTSFGQTCIFVGGRPAQLAAMLSEHGTPTAAYRALLGEIGVGQTLSGAQPAGPVRYVRGLPNGYLRRPYGPGWALVGDAGHWLDPMSTHGMTSALRDVELAGRVLSGPTGDDPAAPDRWEQYRVERDRLSLPLLRASDAIAAHDWDLHTIRRLLRAMASGMADEVDALTDDRAA